MNFKKIKDSEEVVFSVGDKVTTDHDNIEREVMSVEENAHGKLQYRLSGTSGLWSGWQLKKISDSLNDDGMFVFDLTIGFPDFYPESQKEEQELFNRIFKPFGYPKESLTDGENWIELGGNFEPFDTIYGKQSSLFGTFGAVSNTDNVDVIRKIMSDYVSKYYDGDFEIMIEEYIDDSKKQVNDSSYESENPYLFVAYVNLSSGTDLEKYGVDNSELITFEKSSDGCKTFEDAFAEGIKLCYEFAKDFPDETYALDVIAYDMNREINERESDYFQCWYNKDTDEIIWS